MSLEASILRWVWCNQTMIPILPRGQAPKSSCSLACHTGDFRLFVPMNYTQSPRRRATISRSPFLSTFHTGPAVLALSTFRLYRLTTDAQKSFLALGSSRGIVWLNKTGTRASSSVIQSSSSLVTRLVVPLASAPTCLRRFRSSLEIHRWTHRWISEEEKVPLVA